MSLDDTSRFDEIMSDIENGMFGDKEYFKPLVDSISNMKVDREPSWCHLEAHSIATTNYECALIVVLSSHTFSCLFQVGNDWFLVANDFAAYLKAQEEVDKCYKDTEEWTRR